MIRGALASLARNESLGGLISRTPVARDVVKRVVGGETIESALAVAYELADRGYWVSLERTALAEAADDDGPQVGEEYLRLVDAVATAGLAAVCEVTVLPEVLGGRLGPQAVPEPLAALARQAAAAGVPLMLGNGPATDVEASLRWAADLHAGALPVGITLPASRRATEADCRAWGDRRVRIVKGGRSGASATSYAQPIEIDKSFVRCAKELLRGTGDPSFATHDPRLVEIVESRALHDGRAADSYEFTFFMGRQEGAQERLLAHGHRVRVYVPYGPEWFERLVGGLAEQPSTITAALRSLLPGSS